MYTVQYSTVQYSALYMLHAIYLYIKESIIMSVDNPVITALEAGHACVSKMKELLDISVCVYSVAYMGAGRV